MQVDEALLHPNTYTKRSVADFVERLTNDYFLTPSHRNSTFSSIDPTLCLPSLDRLVPNLAARVGTACHYLGVIDKRHVPTTYLKPLEKPLVVPAVVGLIMIAIVSDATGVRVPMTALDTWLISAVHGNARNVSIAYAYMPALQRVETAAIARWRKAKADVSTFIPPQLFRPCVEKTPPSLFDEAKRIVRAVRHHVPTVPNHFLAQVWASLVSQLCCTVYVSKVAHILVDAQSLLSGALSGALPIIDSVEASISGCSAMHQEEILAGTSADVAVACVMASAMKSLNEYFAWERVTLDSLIQSSALLAKLHADLSAYLRLSSIISPRDEKLLDMASEFVRGKGNAGAPVALSIERFGSAHGRQYSVAHAVPLCETLPRQGNINYTVSQPDAQPTGEYQPATVACKCSLVRHHLSLKRFRDALVLPASASFAVAEPLTADMCNGSRTSVLSSAENDSAGDIQMPLSDTKQDALVDSYILSEEDRNVRRQIINSIDVSLRRSSDL